MPHISVVIPTLEEASRIGPAVARILEQPGFHEVIVADGGSRDATAAIAEEAGATVVQGPPGRGIQLNRGAREATGDVLLFLHADVELPDAAAIHIADTLAPVGVVAGAFTTRHYDDPRAQGAWRFGPIVHMADMRSRFARIPYGDQGLFLRAETFERVGGYPGIPLMEDTAIGHRLWEHGRIALAPASVRVSARRWQTHPFRTTLIMNTFPMAYRLGVSPHQLHRLYQVIR